MKGGYLMHIAKFARCAVGNIFYHIERDGTRNHSNTNIDKARTHLNYTLLEDGQTVQKRYEQILQRDDLKVSNRNDLKTVVSCCITLPQNITDEEQQRQFFEAVFQAHCEKFGKENVIFAEVHCDETQKHLHFGFVPIVKDKKPKAKKKFKVSAKELITKEFLQTYHKDIEDRINEILPFKVSLLKTAEEISKNAPVPMGIYKKRFEAMEDFQNEQIEKALETADAVVNRANEDAKTIIENATQKAKSIVADVQKVCEENALLKEENAQLKEELNTYKEVVSAYDELALEFMLEDAETTIQLLQECNFSNDYIQTVYNRAKNILQKEQQQYEYEEECL